MLPSTTGNGRPRLAGASTQTGRTGHQNGRILFARTHCTLPPTPAEGLPLRTWPRKSGESGRGGGSRGTSPSSGVHTRTSGIATLRAVSVGGPDTPSLPVIAAAGGGGSRRREAGKETTGAEAPRGRRQRRIQERGRALFSPRGRRGSPTEPGTLVTMSVFTK